ncbi:MAG: hypothetical protein ABIP34_09305 [Rhodoferax sp.]|uniref:hypothetical protein n=1 Tax=Rhodoferax sp. TaxID=50421 RepID=UPI003266373D
MFVEKCKWVSLSLLVGLLGACAAPAKVVEPEAAKVTLESSLAEANSAQAAGQTDQAVILLKGATNKFPTDKTPWLRIAQIKFDSANYGEAITNALEALQRDPTDKIANSIVTVSGLRLATKSLSDLRTQNALSGTVKNEAQDLAKILRENLGETVLVPAPAATQNKLRAPVTAGKAPIISAKPVRGAPAPIGGKSGADEDAGKSNPFGGLK